MRFFKLSLLVALLFMFGSVANAAPDPVCVGATLVPAVDYSDGTGGLCFPLALANGTPLAETKVLTCTITFFDGSVTPVQIGTETFTGEPGSLHTFVVPRDGTGTSESSCVLDTLVSATTTVVVTFPVSSVPNPPVVLP